MLDSKRIHAMLGVDQYGIPLSIPLSVFTKHFLLLGSTGSGKTSLLRTLASSVLQAGGGFCLIDGKADVLDTYLVLYSIVEQCDRLEDLLVMNFLNPEQSHTFNFLKYGDADFLSEVLSNFLPEVSGDGSYFQERGKAFMRGLLSVLVYMRDHRELFSDFYLNINTIREYSPLPKLVELMDDERIPEYHNNRPVKARLRMYLDELGPAWRQYNSPKAMEIVKQHGYSQQQWTSPLDFIGGTYYNIFVTDEPDIDLIDVVQNSRILVVLLPSLRYAPTTLQALGKMILGVFKVVLDTALGQEVVGETDEIITKYRRQRPLIPFMLYCDEYGSYAVKGMDTILAQARSLGISVGISAQEIASLKKADEVEMVRLLNNTNIKITGKIEDESTAELLAKRTGEEYVLLPSAVRYGTHFPTVGNYEGTYSYQKHYRVEQRDFMSLEVGEFYCIYGDEVRKFKADYITPKGVERMYLHQFVKKVDDSIQKIVKGLKEVRDVTSWVIRKIASKVYSDVRDYAVDIVSINKLQSARFLLKRWFNLVYITDNQQCIDDELFPMPEEELKKFGNYSDAEIAELKRIIAGRKKYFKEFLFPMYQKASVDEDFKKLKKMTESFKAYLQAL